MLEENQFDFNLSSSIKAFINSVIPKILKFSMNDMQKQGTIILNTNDSLRRHL